MKWMAQTIIFFTLGVVAFLPVGAAAQKGPQADSPGLSSLIRYAIRHNPALRITRQNIEMRIKV
jgi:hypothetical protein